jgi:PAT family beta-lactamase induction signal transducer AmpG
MLLVSNAGISWRASYLLMSLLMVPALLATLAAPEPLAPVIVKTAPLRDNFVDPVLDLFQRRRGLVILTLVLIFKLPEYLASAVTVQFIRASGISLASMATVRQGLGLFVLIAGALAGGAFVRRCSCIIPAWRR